ncbi:MAG: hypothetical protein Q9222_004217 [Ikaeria aurantiellina]
MEYSSSSNKVTVEFTDPSSIYPIISTGLQKQFPLRNLYWNSATRPLRSIPLLQIELVQGGSWDESPDVAGRDGPAAHNGATGNLENKHAHRNGGQSGSDGSWKPGRRHQIPGLRRTPYLKVFFLHCNDVESYRSKYRAQIRAWIKRITPPAQSTASVNTQEFHDAFEWLIMHVILPDDGRSVSTSNVNKTDTRIGFQGFAAVNEKLRNDFNGSSKTAVDRVSQVQVDRDVEPARSTSGNEGSSVGWDDFVAKAKSLILSSFDLRVSQYEDDIREKESQRSMPGWNFNTFFVLKEGLARGFESVGLVEDALAGYHELAVGLNAIVEDSDEQHGDRFKDYTNDLSAELKRILQGDSVRDGSGLKTFSFGPGESDQTGEPGEVLGLNLLDVTRKPYRELILANEISIFDFRCYLFAQEVSLLLRLASSPESLERRNEVNQKAVEHRPSEVSPEIVNVEMLNLALLAEVCRRATDFFALAARLIREDLRRSIHPLSRGQARSAVTNLSSLEDPIENVVASWIYSACQSILNATNASSLTNQLAPLLHNLKLPDETSNDSPMQRTGVSRGNLPNRTSSLPDHVRTQFLYSTPGTPSSSETGAQELAGQRAELILLERRILASVGRRWHNFSIGQPDSAIQASSDDPAMDEISLTNTAPTSLSGEELKEVVSRGTLNRFQNKSLEQSVLSEDAFNKAYEDLTMLSLALNILGGKRRSAQTLTADLAAIRFHTTRFSSAASLFQHLASFYNSNDWNRLEIPMLDMYAQALKHLRETQDFVRVGLQLLAKMINDRRPPPDHSSNKLLSKPVPLDHYLQDVIDASRDLNNPVMAPLYKYLGKVYLDPYIRHSHEEDGFQMSLNLQSLLPAAAEYSEVKVKIVSVDDDKRCELWLTSEIPRLIQPGANQITLDTMVMCPGWYRLEKIELRIVNITFDFGTNITTSDIYPGSPVTSDMFDQISEANSMPFLVWPDVEALEVRMSPCSSVHLGKLRLIEIFILSGRNKVSHGKLSLRPCSAGLRLHTVDVDINTDDCPVLDKSQSGSLMLGAVDAHSRTSLRIPYSLESDLTEIKVKVDFLYSVDNVDYAYSDTANLPIQLPLSVNVQDNYQARALFSNFKVGTASSNPARINAYEIHSRGMFQVVMQPPAGKVLNTFAHQPLSLVAKIERDTSKAPTVLPRNPADSMLVLQIRYACIDQEISTAVEEALRTALYQSNLGAFSRLLSAALAGMVRSGLSTQDLETVSLLHEIRLDSFERYDWGQVLNGLQPGTRADLAVWLTKWHTEHTAIYLPQQINDQDLQELIVPVDIPQMPTVVTAWLDLSACQMDGDGAYFTAIDRPLLAEVAFQYSPYWTSEAGNTSITDDQLRITYDVQGSSDTWLVGGQRKGQFGAKAGSTSKFPIILLAQKVGHLLYPTIEVRILERSGQEAADKGIACEVDYINQSDSILVIPDLSSSTVSLAANNAGGGAWLVDSKSRLKR